MTYRITRTVVRGQFANEQCFVTWLAAMGGAVRFVKLYDEPQNNGGSNDTRLYLWEQREAIKTSTCPNSAPDLVTHSGVDGWESQSAAESVVAYELGQGQVLKDLIDKANANAVSPENIAAGVASDIAKDAQKVVSSPIVGKVVGGLVVVGAGWLLLKVLTK